MYAASNTTYLRLVTASATNIDFAVFGTTHTSTPVDSVLPLATGRITTATTTTLYQPASGTEAQIRHIVITNEGLTSNTVTVEAYDGTLGRVMWRGPIPSLYSLHWVERDGVWRMYDSNGALVGQTDQTYAGTVFPTAPYSGQPFYRTDLQDLFHWDASRSKWLGELDVWEWGRGGTVANLDGLRYGGNVITSTTTSAPRSVYDLTIVAASAQHNATPVDGDFTIWENTTKITKIIMTSSFDFKVQDPINADFAGNSLMTVSWEDFEGSLVQTDIADAIVRVHTRRRAT